MGIASCAARWRRALALAGLLAFAPAAIMAAPAAKRPATPGALPAVKVRDLYYGDVLFYFYQDDYFAALTRLTAAQQQGRLAHHEADAELLLGGLYLSLGQHREAGQIFSEVLNRPGVPQPVRDRARFFLGKVWYQRGYFDKAADTLEAAGKAGLTPSMDAERRMLLAQALLYQGKYPAAIAVLDNWKGPVTWQAYAKFNLGVAFVRNGQLEAGARLLDEIGQIDKSNRELDALRDKANLALGYAMLQANRPTDARPVLERVRLDGPLSTKALLGVGWAASDTQQYREALVPWLELHGRNMLDAAVQESYLAVPYAYGKLNANRQASEYYEAAIREFSTETTRIDESIAAIRRGTMLDTIVKNESRSQLGWFWQLSRLPDAPESRYLYHLLAQNDFQEGLKNFRVLRYLDRNLDAWSTSVEAFDDMLATRRERYERRLPEVLAKLQTVDLEDLQRQRTEIESKVMSAENNGDVAALGTPHEREMWAQVEQMESVLATAGSDPDLEDTRDKVRLVRGVLYWEMADGFKARAWNVRKGVREVSQALRDTEKRWSLVQEAKQAVPDRNGEFGERIAALRPRIAAARERLASLQKAQADYLADIAVRELESQKERISTYMLQARYSLATIYDRASSESEAKRAPPTPTTPPPDGAR
ncbi:MAG: tetratricopeptide repeat protein [Proteobacteria bacterium]|nr:tetratricopeptide repeat protein [Pseudomonadota bacterium]